MKYNLIYPFVLLVVAGFCLYIINGIYSYKRNHPEEFVSERIIVAPSVNNTDCYTKQQVDSLIDSRLLGDSLSPIEIDSFFPQTTVSKITQKDIIK